MAQGARIEVFVHRHQIWISRLSVSKFDESHVSGPSQLSDLSSCYSWGTISGPFYASKSTNIYGKRDITKLENGQYVEDEDKPL